MDPLILSLGVMVTALLVVILLLALRIPSPPDNSPAETRLAELTGALKQITVQQASLSKAVDDKFHTINQRLAAGLQESTEKTLSQMGELQKRLAVIDKAQANIEKLSTEVVGLQDILSNKQDRGAFGEVQLENIVSQLLPPNAYEMQPTLSNRKRADCMIFFPGPPGNIVIDSKFPLEAWRKLQGNPDEAIRRQAEREFRASVLGHVKDIAEKYIVPEETGEGAVMFLPSEAVFVELHANFRDVIDRANLQRVWIVSPTTMMAILHTVRAVFHDVRMREQADVIQKEVLALLQDVRRLDERVGKLRTHFDQAEKDIKLIENSTAGISRHGQRINDLEVEEVQSDPKELLPRD